jgi:hypothetical protein
VLYIETTGSTKVGPKWQAAIRTAISNWNAQAKGSAVSFEETMQREDATLIVRGGLIGDNWDQLSGAVLTSDPWVYADGIQLWVNVGYESTIPHNQKATSMMAIMGIALNIGMNEHIGSTARTAGSARSPTSPGRRTSTATPLLPAARCSRT